MPGDPCTNGGWEWELLEAARPSLQELVLSEVQEARLAQAGLHLAELVGLFMQSCVARMPALQSLKLARASHDFCVSQQPRPSLTRLSSLALQFLQGEVRGAAAGLLRPSRLSSLALRFLQGEVRGAAAGLLRASWACTLNTMPKCSHWRWDHEHYDTAPQG